MSTAATHLGVLAGFVLVAGSVVPATPGAAAATPARTHASHGCATGASDFDGNGGVDLAVSAPSYGFPEGDVAFPATDASLASGRPYGLVRVLMRRRDGAKMVTVAPPTSVGGKPVDSFGDALAEMDLSSHKRASEPCAALVIAGTYGKPRAPQSAIFLYRWLRKSHRFGRIATLTESNIGLGLTKFGSSLASQTMGTNRPRPRAPVLYVSAVQSDGTDAVIRLMLSPHGAITSEQLIAPGPTATSNVPIDSTKARGAFGDQLLGTPDPRQVIIGDRYAQTVRGGGAVIVWNKGTTSQLLTPKSVGLHWPTPSGYSWFGAALFLTTEAADKAGDATSLMIGAPEYDLPSAEGGGVAVQLRYDRSVTPARVITSGSKVWSQNSKGVAGQSDYYDGFGSSFTALVDGKHTVVLTGAPDEKDKRGTGVVDALGTGQVWHASSLGQKQYLSASGDGFGTTLSSLHDITDRLPHDPFPQTTAHDWASRAVVATPPDDWFSVGLPTKANRHFTVHRLSGPRPCASDIGCDYGQIMTSSLGG
jgi:hypothetical protein